MLGFAPLLEKVSLEDLFVSAMEKALHLCDWHDLTLHAPYLHLTKADILKIGINLGVDSSLTWTCYGGEERACRKCGACVERIAAFREAGAMDPVEYREPDSG
jgi:7-cyano-7-deazaguanine synthase